MSNACIKWYNENCSCIGSFNVTMDIIKKNNQKTKKIVTNNTTKTNRFFSMQNLLLNIN